MRRWTFVFVACMALSFSAVNVPSQVDAHRSGCHAAHSCPSDHGTYVCGDTGHFNFCGDVPPVAAPLPLPPVPIAAPVTAPVAVPVAVPVSSTGVTFADPAFATQWQAGEAITSNFWGPLATARDGQQEAYQQGIGGKRLVQYFDKARMELTNPTTGVVTNGLLAKELITGQLQTGNALFEARQPASIPVAGDPDNIGPTYASINMNATTLLANTSSAAGSSTTRLLGGTGTLGTYTGTYANDPQGTIAAYDADTQHNVPAAFSNYRTKAGLLTIGFAISEPFWSNVKVAGMQKDVLVQAFQRRILTYTPTNPAAFQVEFGNIGQHYYTWRYGDAAPTTAPVPVAGTHVGPADLYPNPSLTPGDVFPNVTAKEVCVSGYSASVRSVSSDEKRQVAARYGYTGSSSNVEYDHFISLELGGSNAVTNLWPESYATTDAPNHVGAREKDRVENALHAAVCRGDITLQQAQDQIRTDWYAYFLTIPK